jgi:integrase
VIKCALRRAPLVFVSPTELRKANWAEFDLNGRDLAHPASRITTMPARLVPLARQAAAILRDLQSLTGCAKPEGLPHYVFLGPARTCAR